MGRLYSQQIGNQKKEEGLGKYMVIKFLLNFKRGFIQIPHFTLSVVNRA